MQFQFDDGGRKAAGYRGATGDCVVRAIAIATEQPYADVYRDLGQRLAEYAASHRDRVAQRVRSKGVSVRDGVSRQIYEAYLLALGWTWTPTMRIGSGCKIHLVDGELPSGRIICRLSRHLVAVVDGVIHDTSDPQREVHVLEPDHGGPLKPGQTRNVNGIHTIRQRCVYGYYSRQEPLTPSAE